MKLIKVSILGVLFLVGHLDAEDIQLKDGSKITGKLVGVKDETFTVKTAYGEINVPRSQVLTIGFPENQPTARDAGDTPAADIEESLKGTSYVNRTANFNVQVPSGWKLAPSLRKSKDIVAALQSADETQFFLVTPEKFVGSLATYKVLAETQYKSKFSDYQKLSESTADLDGQHGIRLTFVGTTSATKMQLKFLVYILPYDGRMVRLTFFTLEPLFADSTATFEKVAATYRSVKDPK